MRIPTKTRMQRHLKDGSPVSTSCESGTSDNSCGESSHLLHPNYALKLRSSPSTSSSTSTSSGQRSRSASTSISLLREDLLVSEEFAMIKTLNTGSFSKIVLATLKKDLTSPPVVVKGHSSQVTSVADFNREVELTHRLSPHPNVVTCYNLTFLWDYYAPGEGSLRCFLQEYAPHASLDKMLSRQRDGLGESKTKLVCSQVASALEFMHHLRLVHGAVTPSHVLIFRSDCSLVKLTDFSKTHPEGAWVLVREDVATWASFSAPELGDLLPGERYEVSWEQDGWSLGVLAVWLLGGGRPPWALADALQDPGYRGYVTWLKRRNTKVPEALRGTTPRFRRMFKRLCEPKGGQRSGVREVSKYLRDGWLLKRSVERSSSTGSRKISSSSSGGETEKSQNVPGKEVILEKDKAKKLEEWVTESCLNPEKVEDSPNI